MRDDPDAWRARTERAAAHRRVPDRHVRQAPRPAHAGRAREAGRGGHADDPPRDQPARSATAISSCWRVAAASRSACCSRSCTVRSRSPAWSVGHRGPCRRQDQPRRRDVQPGRARSGGRGRTLEPVEASLLRVLLRAPGTSRDGLGDRVTTDLFVTTPARELWLPARGHAVGRLRPRRVRGVTRSHAGGGRRTLFARTDPIPDDDGALRQAVEQSLLGLERNRITERLEFVRARCRKPKRRATPQTAERLRREVLEPQATAPRPGSAARPATTRFFNQRRHSTPPRRPRT